MQRQPRRHDGKHLRFISERPCLICGRTPSDPHHIKMADWRVCKPQSSNIGMKADDRFVLPLCRDHHEELHSTPERTFYAKYSVDAILLSLALYSVSGNAEQGDQLVDNAMVLSGIARGLG